MCKVESVPLYMTNQKQARFLSLSSVQSVLGLAREDLSCSEIEISDSSILKETAAARLDAESLSNRSPTSGENGKVWELGGVWNWIINKKSRGSKLNFPNELSVLGLAREDLSCSEIEISDSSILKETAAARLDAESLSNRSPTSGENGKVWELGGVWNWIINKKSRGSKLNFPNELILFISMGKVESAPLYMTNQKQARFLSLSCPEDLSCTEIEISDSSILKETATARLDAESLSNRSPTSGENGKVWELGGVWNWIINKKSRGSKLNFPNELVE
ncbi:hypothetical protein F2Q69_00047326 [Brassica cretica]|uniref:Uncharacterized protein n=1 Tax=Brassica cretica TaxID=69181 RepID=A0A8S9Q1D0_BRACR|nr:hypothetical protein F2Q69_00047326 [Brassica cretica]